MCRMKKGRAGPAPEAAGRSDFSGFKRLFVFSGALPLTVRDGSGNCQADEWENGEMKKHKYKDAKTKRWERQPGRETVSLWKNG